MTDETMSQTESETAPEGSPSPPEPAVDTAPDPSPLIRTAIGQLLESLNYISATTRENLLLLMITSIRNQLRWIVSAVKSPRQLSGPPARWYQTLVRCGELLDREMARDLNGGLSVPGPAELAKFGRKG